MQQHSSLRFAIAIKQLRRLNSALEFLNFHRIIHGNVSQQSTIMQIVDDKVENVLLVDYSTTYTFPSGDTAPKEAMVADSKAVSKLIDDCCDTWTLPKSATKNAQSEAVLRERTVEVADGYAIVKRCCADYFGRQGQSKASVKGKKLLRLLEMMAIEWNSAQAEQLQNGTLKEVRYVFKSSLDCMN